MDPTAIFWFIYSFYLATFIWNFYLTLRQYNVYRKTETRPKKVSGIISNEDFVKARNYNLDKMHFGFYEIAFGKTLSTIILFCNLIPWLWSICGRYGQIIWPRSGEIFQSVHFIVFSSSWGAGDGDGEFSKNLSNSPTFGDGDQPYLPKKGAKCYK
uniref:CAAX prenyl protease 1 N-terminal domain-containing protein n=1 Tax=Meloidogyne incognita TaxID=6306 RepID=A0A914MQE7_MELIC